MKKYLILIALFFSWISTVSAAQLYILTEKTEFQAGDVFTASVYVDTSGVAINSIEGSVDFSPAVLAVESVSIGGSVFSVWVEQPSFSNTSGKIFFNGGVPNPGYIGSRGLVARVTFRAKQSGAAQIIPTATIYANDGLGTAIAPTVVNTSVSVTPESVSTQEQSTPVPVPKTTTVSAPVVSSVEMPDPEKWYAKKNAVFSWNVPNDVSTVRLLLGSFPNSQPTVSYTPPIGNKELTGVQDGVSYLHVGFVYTNGQVSVAHRKIKVDTTPPTELVATSSIGAGDTVELTLSAKDSLSGIVQYELWEGGARIASFSAAQAKAGPVTLPQLSSGTHSVEVRVSDAAGNTSVLPLTLSVPALQSPSIDSYPQSIQKGEIIRVSGTSYPKTNISVSFVDSKGKTQSVSVVTDSSGRFTIASEPTGRDGAHTVFAQVERNSIKSEPSQKVTVYVQKSTIDRTSMEIINTLSLLVVMAVLLAILLFIVFATYRKLYLMKLALHKELIKTENDVHRIFTLIKNDLEHTIRILNKSAHKKHLTDVEKETVETFEKDLAEAETYLTKRLEKIEREDL